MPLPEEEFVDEKWGKYTFRFKAWSEGINVTVWERGTMLPLNPWPYELKTAVGAWLSKPMGMPLRDYLTKMLGDPNGISEGT